MKRVIQGENLWEEMEKAVNLLCDAVSSTLGPTGNNVLINSWDRAPYITKDGVTIAESIESEDPIVNTILEIVKEASLKTNEKVGDGTTTTIVLLQKIFNEGLKALKRGYNPILLKEELEQALEEVLEKLEQEKRKPTKDNLLSIATIAANNKEIGNLVFNVYQKMKNKYSIQIREGQKEYSYFEIKKGYTLEIDKLSSLYFKKEEPLFWTNVYVLVLKGRLESLEEISEILNEVYVSKRSLLILAEELESSVQEEVLSLYLTNSQKIVALTIPEYASHREGIEEDLIKISNANVKNVEYEQIQISDVGEISSLKIEKEYLTLSLNKETIKDHIKSLKSSLKNCPNNYEKEFIAERLSKLVNGIATIYVGGITKTEIKEKIMRFEDALCAVDQAKSGVVIGEGVTFLKIGMSMIGKSKGSLIVKESLEAPFKKIMENLGKDLEKVKQEIEKHDYQEVYEYQKDSYENIKNTSILDSYTVIKTAIKNAVSIASILLTTKFLIVNEKGETEKEFL